MKAAPSGRRFLAGSLSLAGLASLRVVVVAAAVVGVIITLETVMPGTAMVAAAMATVATAKVTVMATVMVTVTAAHRQRQPLTGLTYPLSPA